MKNGGGFKFFVLYLNLFWQNMSRNLFGKMTKSRTQNSRKLKKKLSSSLFYMKDGVEKRILAKYVDDENFSVKWQSPAPKVVENFF
jgi:hypothetical protein